MKTRDHDPMLSGSLMSESPAAIAASEAQHQRDLARLREPLPEGPPPPPVLRGDPRVGGAPGPCPDCGAGYGAMHVGRCAVARRLIRVVMQLHQCAFSVHHSSASSPKSESCAPFGGSGFAGRGFQSSNESCRSSTRTWDDGAGTEMT